MLRINLSSADTEALLSLDFDKGRAFVAAAEAFRTALRQTVHDIVASRIVPDIGAAKSYQP